MRSARYFEGDAPKRRSGGRSRAGKHPDYFLHDDRDESDGEREERRRPHRAGRTDQTAEHTDGHRSASGSTPAGEEEEADGWQYKDPEGQVHGPFPASKIQAWLDKGFFGQALEVSRIGIVSTNGWRRLGDVLLMVKKEAAGEAVVGSGAGGKGGGAGGTGGGSGKERQQQEEGASGRASAFSRLGAPVAPRQHEQRGGGGPGSVSSSSSQQRQQQQQQQVPASPEPGGGMGGGGYDGRRQMDRGGGGAGRSRGDDRGGDRGGGVQQRRGGDRGGDRGGGGGRGGQASHRGGGSGESMAIIANRLFTAGATLATDEPLWRYIDADGNVQGPFPAAKMAEWLLAGFLPQGLMACGTDRKVSPPNLPDRTMYRPLASLMFEVANGSPFRPVTTQDIQHFKQHGSLPQVPASAAPQPAAAGAKPVPTPSSSAAPSKPAAAKKAPEHTPEELDAARRLFHGGEARVPLSWYYLDKKEQVQGPFGPAQMVKWYTDSWLTNALHMAATEPGAAKPDVPLYVPLAQLLDIVAKGYSHPFASLTPVATPRAPSRQGQRVDESVLGIFRQHGEGGEAECDASRWYYVDALDKIQGPFVGEDMAVWCQDGHITLVCKADGTEQPDRTRFVSIQELLERAPSATSTAAVSPAPAAEAAGTAGAGTAADVPQLRYHCEATAALSGVSLQQQEEASAPAADAHVPVNGVAAAEEPVVVTDHGVSCSLAVEGGVVTFKVDSTSSSK